MRIVGVSQQDGAMAFTHSLPHGADPQVIVYDLGYVSVRPIDAVRSRVDSVLELRCLVRPVAGESRPATTELRRDAGLDLGQLAEPTVRQRIAAYAVVQSSQGLLATEFSDRTSVPGLWGLPGGGIGDYEEPADAVLREVAEETSQDVALGELVAVQSAHWIGRSPLNTVEDFHAVRLVYAGHCAHPTTPVVVDAGGTTESARWVPLHSWRLLAWTSGWRDILNDLLDSASS